MCKPASFVITKDRIFWSKTSDAHEDIIAEHELHVDSIAGPKIVRVEISPPKGNFSLSLCDWVYHTDQDSLPAWYDPANAERECRITLQKWAAHKLTGWKVKEAFNPVNPLLLQPQKISKKQLLKYL